MEKQELLQLLKDAHSSLDRLYDMAMDDSDYFPMPDVYDRLEDAIKTLSEPCQCKDCAVCRGEHVVCGTCGMCTRCHKHKEGCIGCQGEPDQLKEIAKKVVNAYYGETDSFVNAMSDLDSELTKNP